MGRTSRWMNLCKSSQPVMFFIRNERKVYCPIIFVDTIFCNAILLIDTPTMTGATMPIYQLRRHVLRSFLVIWNCGNQFYFNEKILKNRTFIYIRQKLVISKINQVVIQISKLTEITWLNSIVDETKINTKRRCTEQAPTNYASCSRFC